MAIIYIDLKGEKPRRIGFLYHDNYYKLFSYFTASSIDDSLGVHCYLRAKSIGVMTLGKDFDKKPINIDKNNPQIDQVRFDIHKVNFHKSGIITEKNKVGESYKLHSHSMSFEKIDKYINLMLIVPALLDSYPNISESERLKKKFTLLDYGELFPATPIKIELYLSSNNFDFQTKIIDRLIKKGVVLRDSDILKKSNLTLYTLITPSKKNKHFPPHHISGVFKNRKHKILFEKLNRFKIIIEN